KKGLGHNAAYNENMIQEREFNSQTGQDNNVQYYQPQQQFQYSQKTNVCSDLCKITETGQRSSTKPQTIESVANQLKGNVFSRDQYE
ncbi:hypothetical protein HAX54_015300, partial [Datura stramonium]|nr:hypothetical protein [Datura stramonium]